MASGEIIRGQDNLNVRALSNWNIAGDKNIYDAISIRRIDNSDPCVDVSIGSIVSLESCIHLKPHLSETCTFTLNSTSSSQTFKALHIVSGSKYIEVYIGSIFEYYKTFKAELYDDYEDTIIYKVEIQFKEPILQCMLKFINTATPSSLWIYGVLIITDKSHICMEDRDLVNNISTNKIPNSNVKLHNTEDPLHGTGTAKVIVSSMKQYMDGKFLELEQRISAKLSDIEKNQKKLSKLIENLEKMIISNAISFDKIQSIT